MKVIYFLIFFSFVLMSCQTEKNVSKYPSTVGNIEFDSELDDADFKKCIPEKLVPIQYYQGNQGFNYRGEKIAIEEKLKRENIFSKKDINGYFTVRFIVNCDGKTGLFRGQHMDSDFKEKNLDQDLENKLLLFTKSLDGWIPKEMKGGVKIGYYQYLTYKIENGKVSEVLP